MPNWKVTPALRAAMASRLMTLLQRRIVLAQSAFPLDRDEFQSCVMARDTIERIEYLTSRDLAPVQRFNSARVRLDAGGAIGRTTVVQIYCPSGFWLSRGSASVYGTAGSFHRWEPKDPTQVLALDTQSLSADKRAALAKWTNNVVRELRTGEVVAYVVSYLLDNHMPSAAHIAVRWPLLTTLVEDKEWRRRLQYMPKRTAPYAWTEYRSGQLMPGPYEKLMQIAEAALLGAEMLPDVKPSEEIAATVQAWIPLEKDWHPSKPLSY